MLPSHRRHGISPELRELLKPQLPGIEGVRGVTAKDNRQFIQLYSRCYVLFIHSVIYRLIMVTGSVHTADFVVGEIKKFWKNSLKYL